MDDNHQATEGRRGRRGYGDLCDECHILDFKAVFHHGRSCTGLHRLSDVSSIRSNSKICKFCEIRTACIDASFETSTDSADEDWTLDVQTHRASEYRIMLPDAQSSKTSTSLIQSLKAIFFKTSQDRDKHQKTSLHLKALGISYSGRLYTWKRRGKPVLKHELTMSIFAMGNPNDAPKNQITRGRPVDPAQVDYGRIRDWIKRCDTKHKEPCRRIALSWNSLVDFDFRLIDVEIEALVNATKDTKYLALSYVWGSMAQLKLSRSNKVDLFQSGSLSKGKLGIPKTIFDAMYLCKMLGERYLWVDALCILQDDEQDRSAQIANMGSIYSHAYLTIVAAAGDAENGLPGVGPNNLRKAALQVSIRGMKLSTAPANLGSILAQSKWSTRGWTLQEQLLSRRLLVFSDTIVLFDCKTVTFREDVTLEADEGVLCLPGLEHYTRLFDINGKPEFKQSAVWMHVRRELGQLWLLLSGYCSRRLSLDTDILDAFAGVARTFEPALGQFRYGLPMEYLGLMMLWIADSGCLSSRRLIKSIPSWSWAAWKECVPCKDTPGFIGEMSTVSLVRFFSPSLGGECVALPISYIATTLDYLEDHSGSPEHNHHHSLSIEIKEHCKATSTLRLEEELMSKLSSPLDRYLVFWTSTALLDVDRQLSSQGRGYSVRDTTDNVIGHLDVTRTWRESHPDKVEFILLAVSRWYHLHVMAIETTEGISQRVQVLRQESGVEWRNSWLFVWRWLKAQPQRKLIVLE